LHCVSFGPRFSPRKCAPVRSRPFYLSVHVAFAATLSLTFPLALLPLSCLLLCSVCLLPSRYSPFLPYCPSLSYCTIYDSVSHLILRPLLPL